MALTSYWRLNTDSNDCVGTNHGTDTNVSYVAGQVGGCAKYVAASTSNSVSASALGGTKTGDKTIQCLIKFEALHSGTNKYHNYILLFYNKVMYAIGYWRESNINKFIVSYDRIDVASQLIAFTNPSAQKWYLLQATMTGTTLKLYIDSKLIGTLNISTADGTRDVGVGFEFGRTYDVSLDDIKIHTTEIKPVSYLKNEYLRIKGFF